MARSQSPKCNNVSTLFTRFGIGIIPVAFKTSKLLFRKFIRNIKTLQKCMKLYKINFNIHKKLYEMLCYTFHCIRVCMNV